MGNESKVYYVRRNDQELEVAPTLDPGVAGLPPHERKALWSMLFDVSGWAAEAKPGEKGSVDFRPDEPGVGEPFGLYLKDYEGYVWDLMENRSPALSRVELAELYGLVSTAEEALSKGAF